MNSPHKPQTFPGFRLKGLGAGFTLGALALLPASPSAFSAEGEAALEILRDKVSAGLAGQESYDALLDLLAEGEDLGCEAGSEPPVDAVDGIRGREIRAAMAEACLDHARDTSPPHRPEARLPSDPAPDRVRKVRTRFSASQSLRPRQGEDATAPAPGFLAEGSMPGLAGRLSLRDYHPYSRALRLGNARLSVLAGHFHSALEETRLAFVAGSRFYAGWSGTSGLGGAWFSPQAALDGLALRARIGGWRLEGAGAWNRLDHGLALDSTERRDAILFTAGLAWTGIGRKGGAADFGFRTQAAFQRFESSLGSPLELMVAGVALDKRDSAGLLWQLGGGASWIRPALLRPPHSAHQDIPDPSSHQASGPREDSGNLGGYLEASLSSATLTSGTLSSGIKSQAYPPDWRLQIRQASSGWANPLHSPRGYLRDTLDGRWILPGRGEGGLSARSRFPVIAFRAFRVDLQGGGAAGWDPDGLLAGEAGLAWIQVLGNWTHEAGSSLAFRHPGSPASGGATGNGEGRGFGGWGQSLAWRRGVDVAKAVFTWKGRGYSGSRPAPFSLAWERKGKDPWAAQILTGDVRNPWGYLSLEVRERWWVEKGVKVEQTLRLPWNREGIQGGASGLSYQLRLEAAL